MESVVEEFVWNESDDILVYEKNGVQKKLVVAPNRIITRSCHTDIDKYLIGQVKDAGPEYGRYVEHLEKGYCNFCEVLAVGRSRKWSKAESKKYKIAPRWTIPVEVGDYVLMPEQDKWGRMWRYILDKPYLHMAEFHVPILIIQKEDIDD
jgi:hypothetical protein